MKIKFKGESDYGLTGHFKNLIDVDPYLLVIDNTVSDVVIRDYITGEPICYLDMRILSINQHCL